MKDTYQQGWQDGYNFSYDNWGKGLSASYFVESHPNGNDGIWHRGFREGIISGSSKKLSELFPGAKQISLVNSNYQATY